MSLLRPSRSLLHDLTVNCRSVQMFRLDNIYTITYNHSVNRPSILLGCSTFPAPTRTTTPPMISMVQHFYNQTILLLSSIQFSCCVLSRQRYHPPQQSPTFFLLGMLIVPKIEELKREIRYTIKLESRVQTNTKPCLQCLYDLDE